MKVINEIELKVKGKKKSIYFGIPEGDEIDLMYQFRYRIYFNHGYINQHESGKDVDEYDKGKSVYFIAKIDDRIIGTVRLIHDDYLPTEKDCFEFEEPKVIKNISRIHRVELGRLIVERYQDNNFLPRNLVMLGLFFSVVEYSKSNNFIAGYSFIKDTLKIKLDTLKIPYHPIEEFKIIYSKGILEKYFNDSVNKVRPIYYLVSEIDSYISKVFRNIIFFKKIDHNKYKFRNSFLLRLLNY